MFKDVTPKAKIGTTAKARQLRRTMTLPEVLLWQVLRERPNGLKFRRQHPSGAYVLDFFCADARLAIEIDGEGHGNARDDIRDAWFEARGIATLRIPAVEALRDLDAVARHIVAMAVARLPLHHPSGGPPPRAPLGEE